MVDSKGEVGPEILEQGLVWTVQRVPQLIQFFVECIWANAPISSASVRALYAMSITPGNWQNN